MGEFIGFPSPATLTPTLSQRKRKRGAMGEGILLYYLLSPTGRGLR